MSLSTCAKRRKILWKWKVCTVKKEIMQRCKLQKMRCQSKSKAIPSLKKKFRGVKSLSVIIFIIIIIKVKGESALREKSIFRWAKFDNNKLNCWLLLVEVFKLLKGVQVSYNLDSFGILQKIMYKCFYSVNLNGLQLAVVWASITSNVFACLSMLV